MKWDYSSVTVWGIDQNGPDGEDIFTREVAALAQSLSCQVESEKTLNGYQQGFKLVRGEDLICQAFTGGTGSAEGSSQFIAASTADEVYPLLQERFPGHGVSRLDAAEDFCGEGTWDRMEAMLTAIAAQHRVSTAPWWPAASFARRQRTHRCHGTTPRSCCVCRWTKAACNSPHFLSTTAVG